MGLEREETGTTDTCIQNIKAFSIKKMEESTKQMFYRFFSLFGIACYILRKSLLRKYSAKINNPSTRILIVFQQIFGDSIIFSDSLQHYTKLYPPEKGYHITLLCRPSIEAFMRDVLPLPEGIDIVSIDFKRMIRDFRYFRQTVQTYDCASFPKVIFRKFFVQAVR